MQAGNDIEPTGGASATPAEVLASFASLYDVKRSSESLFIASLEWLKI